MIYELLEFYIYALGLYLSLFSLTCTGWRGIRFPEVDSSYTSFLERYTLYVLGKWRCCTRSIVQCTIQILQVTKPFWRGRTYLHCFVTGGLVRLETQQIWQDCSKIISWWPVCDHQYHLCATLWPSLSSFYSNVWWLKEVFVWSKQVNVFSINSSLAGLDWDVQHCLKVT